MSCHPPPLRASCLLCSSWSYIQGAGDDEEHWAKGLTPALFWRHRDDLLASDREHACSVLASLRTPSASAASRGGRAAGGGAGGNDAARHHVLQLRVAAGSLSTPRALHVDSVVHGAWCVDADAFVVDLRATTVSLPDGMRAAHPCFHA